MSECLDCRDYTSPLKKEVVVAPWGWPEAERQAASAHIYLCLRANRTWTQALPWPQFPSASVFSLSTGMVKSVFLLSLLKEKTGL